MFDLTALATATTAQGRVARIVLADVRGSAPREAGTAMLVWQDGQSGTIGGGRLELEAITAARDMLAGPTILRLKRQALGPSLHQCCGGAVVLVTEVFDAARLTGLQTACQNGLWARPVDTGAQALPNTLARQIDRQTDRPFPTTLSGGWLVEPIWQPRQPVYIYGAGHVGRALAKVLAPMPQFDVTLADIRPDQFDNLPATITQSPQTPLPEVLITAPDTAAHFIMTPDHDHDLQLCHTLLGRDFHSAGLIGSATKWARFRSRLRALGHTEAAIARITCPIGESGLGKHPQAIAVGVAAGLLNQQSRQGFEQERRA